MHFQIFIPDARGQDPRLLVDVGLADFVAGAEFMETAAVAPLDRAGVVIAWRRPGHVEMGLHPDRQAWLAAVPRDELPGGRFHIGFWNDSPAAPRDLARPYLQPGHRVALGDGNEWTLPIAKALDADMILADDGTWRFEVQRKFHDFYLAYLKWFHFFGNAEPDAEISFAEAADFVLAGLRINYRLTAEAASHLGLFTKDTVLTSLLAILGVERPTAAAN